MLFDRCLAATLFVTLFACARPAPKDAQSVAVAPATPAASVEAPAFAAIALNDEQSVDLTADGTMIDVASETRIAVKQRVLTLKKDTGDGTYACDAYEGEYHGEGLSLVDARGKETVIIEKSARDASENAIAIDKQGSTLLGVVGPYLFLREDHLFFGCGAAHPLHGVGGFVWDSTKEARVELTPPASVIARAATELDGRGFPDAEPAFVEAIPRFDAEGRLSIGWRFEKGTSYAETEGDGSDYNISIIVESAELPEALAPFREPPPAIRNYLANGGEPITGYSLL